MPTTRHAGPDPRPLGDPQPPKPESNPVPTGDPKPAAPDQEPRSEGNRKLSPLFAFYAARKVDDLTRHEARHDEPLTRKPNAREKPLNWVKPASNQPPPVGKSTAAELRR